MAKIPEDPPEPKGVPPWLLTFADLVALLITFFVLLYSMKVVDTQKWEELKGTFEGVFSTEKPIFDLNPDKMTSVENIQVSKADQLEYLQTILLRTFAKDKVLSKVRVTRNMQLDTMTIALPSKLLFSSGSADLNSGGEAALISLGEAIRHLDNTIVVAGHTDPLAIQSAKYPSNWELAMDRALLVAELLESQGVPGPMRAISYGDSRFFEVAPHLTKVERYNLSRRVEVIIHGSKEE